MNTAVIPVDPKDNFGVLKHKILQDQSPRILLILPDRSLPYTTRLKRNEKPARPKKIFRYDYQRIDFILLKRFCKSIGSDLALITRDERWIELAADIHIPVFSDLVEADAAEWEELEKKPKPSFQPKTKKLTLQEQKRLFPRKVSDRSPAWVRWLCSMVGVSLFVCFAWLYIPSATIELVLREETQSVQLVAFANPQVKSVQISGAVPASIITTLVEGEGMIMSSGTLILADQPAVGSVHLTNLTDHEITVPAGTHVLTISEVPVVFLTIQAVTIQPKEEGVEVVVEAELPGSAGNVEAGAIQAFEDQMGLSLLVNNPEPTSGGTDWSGPAPSEQDVEKLRKEIFSDLESQALDQFSVMQQDGQVLIDGSLEMVEVKNETRIPPKGEPGEVLTMKIVAEYSMWVVDLKDLETLGNMVLDASLMDGMVPVQNTLELNTISEPVLSSNGAEWTVEASRKVKQDHGEIDPSVFAGKRLDEVKTQINNMVSLASEPVIMIKPVWWKRMPFLSPRIELVVQ